MLRVSDSIRDGIRFAIPEPTEWQQVGNPIGTAMIATWADSVNVHFAIWKSVCRCAVESKNGRMLPVMKLYTVGKIVLTIVLAFLIFELFW